MGGGGRLTPPFLPPPPQVQGRPKKPGLNRVKGDFFHYNVAISRAVASFRQEWQMPPSLNFESSDGHYYR